MAARKLLVSFLIVIVCCNYAVGSRLPEFDSIYQFGDSISDTGNHIKEKMSFPYNGDPYTHPIEFTEGLDLWHCANPPYGETLSAEPTGRCSDGLLMLDFFARAFGLAPVKPYLEENADFTHGVNFAVSAATALDASTYPGYAETPSTLKVQLEWFRNHLGSICSKDCKKKLEKALFVVGAFGGTDYLQHILVDMIFDYQEFTRHLMAHVVPDVVQTVANAVKEVIDHGAVQVVVPGHFPMGCMPFFRNNVLEHDLDPTMYDDQGCLKPFNEVTKHHNELLRKALEELKKQHPRVSIHYGDCNSAFRWLVHNARSLGFRNDDDVLKPCILEHPYGEGPTDLCPDPTKLIFWDNIHMTQEAHKHMARWLLSDIFEPTVVTPEPTTATSPSPTPQASGANHAISKLLLQGVLTLIITMWAMLF